MAESCNMENTTNIQPAVIQKGFCSLKDDNLLFDVELEADGKTLKAHKALLAAVSPYFRYCVFDCIRIIVSFCLYLLGKNMSYTNACCICIQDKPSVVE